jgi:DNA-3-methyladenine glycosylase I
MQDLIYSQGRARCGWCGDDPLYQTYHDQEWGRPSYDEVHLFEMLILEGAQAGLSWITILRKRHAYRDAFVQFDAQAMACMGEADQQLLLHNPGIVRNRLKIKAAIENARAYLKLREQGHTLSHFLWQFVDGEPLINHWHTLTELPAQTTVSQAMSRELKRCGFRFVGPTICYALMQSVGMVNDHLVGCSCHPGR